jgi:L-fuconolactonase
VTLPDFPIVDAHVHLYDPTKLSFPWMKDVALLNKPHGPAYYDERTAGVTVDTIVFVEVDVAAGHHLAEVRWVSETAKSETRLKAMVAAMPLEKGTAIEPDIAAYAKFPLARGVRRLIQHHLDEPGWCLRPDFVAALKLLPKYKLSFDLCILHPQLADTIELVKRCPEVSFILDHIGKPGIKAGLTEPWRRQMRELAKYHNVMCKISGVVNEADHRNWTYEQIAPYVAHAIDCFGFDRVAFGGDWPVSELVVRYATWVEMVDRVTAGVSRAELRKLYRENAIRFYRI